MYYNFARHLRTRRVEHITSMSRHNRSEGPKTKQIYEIPNDDSKGELLPITADEVKSLKKDKFDLHQIIRVTLALLKTSKLPSEVISDVLEFAGLCATFSAKTDDTKYGKNNMNYEYLLLSIPSLSSLNLPPGITISENCSQLIVECSSHDQGWSSSNQHYNGTYLDSYTWSEVAVMKKIMIDGEAESFDEVSRTMIGKNVRADQSFRHHIKRFYDPDGFIKNIELGDAVKILLRSVYPGWQNTANFASIAVQFPIVVM